MNLKTILITTLGLITLGVTVRAAELDPELKQQKLSFERQAASVAMRIDYLLSLPKGYEAKDTTKKWPLILFLHGSGERGSNVAKVAVHGPPKLVKNGKDLPFIIVSPQCPAGKGWNNDTLLALLDDTVAKHNVDRSRVYLTGLSMGGYGTWSLGLKYPERFAAIAPICGGGQTQDVKPASGEKAAALKSLGVWAFHGAKDPTVKLEASERMVAELKQAGCKDVELTIYPEAGHDSWTESYNNPKLYDWFLQHQRK